MNNAPERQLNHTAYRQLRDEITQNYAAGRFLAISGGQIIADGERFQELRETLEAMGKNPAHVLIVQAGVDYPETAIIFGLNGQR